MILPIPIVTRKTALITLFTFLGALTGFPETDDHFLRLALVMLNLFVCSYFLRTHVSWPLFVLPAFYGVLVLWMGVGALRWNAAVDAVVWVTVAAIYYRPLWQFSQTAKEFFNELYDHMGSIAGSFTSGFGATAIVMQFGPDEWEQYSLGWRILIVCPCVIFLVLLVNVITDCVMLWLMARRLKDAGLETDAEKRTLFVVTADPLEE
ncbi:hypothetical protein BCR33DRAFT_336605 [Rhizoclosmatium globosum]|uniref:Uncharacterized protein n=1 Tax=Rhizoclosmatium globosum TaxID=329046 RepID=A0A1Y2C3L9_9FUNG|nr:hypothetical protein BCR33DRAFT_336605 [Rhizoclosmatium globosum]|eukprot:ORY41619.1 hypothetical protein BCR33DRAFT_336605 [Rhizoclosmatium globosum]